MNKRFVLTNERRRRRGASVVTQCHTAVTERSVAVKTLEPLLIKAATEAAVSQNPNLEWLQSDYKATQTWNSREALWNRMPVVAAAGTVFVGGKSRWK